VRVPLAEMVAVREKERLAEPLRVAEPDTEPDRVTERDTESDRVAERDNESDGATERDTEPDRETDAATDNVGVTLKPAVGDTLADAAVLPLRDGVAATDRDTLGDAPVERETDAERVTERVREPATVLERVRDGERARDGEPEREPLWLRTGAAASASNSATSAAEARLVIRKSGRRGHTGRGRGAPRVGGVRENKPPRQKSSSALGQTQRAKKHSGSASYASLL